MITRIKLMVSLLGTLTIAGGLLGGCESPRPVGAEPYKTAAEKMQDVETGQRVANALQTDKELDDQTILVAIDRGVVQLSGFAKTPYHAQKAVYIAKKQPRVKDVINNIIVRTSPDYKRIRALVEELR